MNYKSQSIKYKIINAVATARSLKLTDMAFEIEKIFVINGNQEKRLLEGATFLNEVIFIDRYYDNEKFSLGENDMWLRRRGEDFCLKIPARQNQKGINDKYHEIEGEMAIREIFAVPIVGNFEDDLKSFGHGCYCELKTTRRKYKKDGFIIDLDEADFGDWKYKVAEIELLVEDKDLIKNSERKIYDFAENCGIKNECKNGALIEFLKKKMPENYQLLKEKSIIV